MRDICDFALGKMPAEALFAFNTNVDAIAKLESLPGLRLPGLMESIEKCEQKEILVGGAQAEALSRHQWQHSIGGQAGRCAQVAAYLGVKSYLNIPVSCHEQNRFFHPNVHCAHNGAFIPAGRVRESGKPPVHYIIEYERGMKIAGQKLHCQNRFIASYYGNGGPMDAQVGFVKLMEGQVRYVNRAVLGGAHLLQENRAHRLEEARALIESWKKRNPELKVHFECGDFQSEKVAKLFLRRVAPVCDSIGINRVECRQLSGREGNAFEAAASLLPHVPLAVLHEPQFAASFSGKDVAWESLAFGNLVAAFYLEHGRLANMGELYAYEPKKRATDRFTFEYRNAKIDCASEFVPTYAILPKLTVGGGDAFAAGFALTY
jgi:ADP-dependent phosphofructokinase/glucokinase